MANYHYYFKTGLKENDRLETWDRKGTNKTFNCFKYLNLIFWIWTRIYFFKHSDVGADTYFWVPWLLEDINLHCYEGTTYLVIYCIRSVTSSSGTWQKSPILTIGYIYHFWKVGFQQQDRVLHNEWTHVADHKIHHIRENISFYGCSDE